MANAWLPFHRPYRYVGGPSLLLQAGTLLAEELRTARAKYKMHM